MEIVWTNISLRPKRIWSRSSIRSPLKLLYDPEINIRSLLKVYNHTESFLSMIVHLSSYPVQNRTKIEIHLKLKIVLLDFQFNNRTFSAKVLSSLKIKESFAYADRLLLVQRSYKSSFRIVPFQSWSFVWLDIFLLLVTVCHWQITILMTK